MKKPGERHEHSPGRAAETPSTYHRRARNHTMTTLLHAPCPVQPEGPDDASDWLSDETEPFHPSLADEAYDLAYRLERDGEPLRRIGPGPVPEEVATALYRGSRAGREARQRAEARAMGRMAGLLTGSSEPPSGLSPHEAASYRAGFAEGALEDELGFDAWVREMESGRLDDAFADPIRDDEIYPAGCVS
jgi:hypothetical protein